MNFIVISLDFWWGGSANLRLRPNKETDECVFNRKLVEDESRKATKKLPILPHQPLYVSQTAQLRKSTQTST